MPSNLCPNIILAGVQLTLIIQTVFTKKIFTKNILAYRYQIY